MLAPHAARTPAAGSPVATQRTRSVATHTLLTTRTPATPHTALGRSTETVPTARAAIQRQVRSAIGTTTPPGFGRFRTQVRRQAGTRALATRQSPPTVRRSRRLRMGRRLDVRRSRPTGGPLVLRSRDTDRGEFNAN